MPSDNAQGRLEEWVRFEATDPVSSFIGFVKAIVNAMQNWVDNSMLKMPGYRDRIAHVYLTDKEGGLNLEMEEGAIERIATRGQYAGELLRDRFTNAIPDVKLDWDNHRWVRYRSTMTLFEKYLHDITGSLDTRSFPNERTYTDLVNRGRRDWPKSYPFTAKQKRSARDVNRRLMGLAKVWDGFPKPFVVGTPKPIPELRSQPKM
jgi:hypothetical protein